MADRCPRSPSRHASGGGNTTAFATVQHGGWVRAIDPNILVYIAIDLPGTIGGDTAYRIVNTSMDVRVPGHLFQAFVVRICETPVNRAKALTYLTRKYVSLPARS